MSIPAQLPNHLNHGLTAVLVLADRVLVTLTDLEQAAFSIHHSVVQHTGQHLKRVPIRFAKAHHPAPIR